MKREKTSGKFLASQKLDNCERVSCLREHEQARVHLTHSHVANFLGHRKIIDIVGTVLLFIGFSLGFLPHAFHIAVGLDNETSHLKHVISGMTLVVVSLAILIYNNKALKVWNKT